MTVTWGTTTTYPNPSTLEEADELVGAVGVMADGSLSIDVLATKKRIKIGWQAIDSTNANNLFAQAITRTSATMDMSNAGGANYGSVVPIPNSARKSPQGGSPLVYDVSVEVRTA
jgi:TRAP-type mannitol/chloroaromatic compound transport system substrate-binding protein